MLGYAFRYNEMHKNMNFFFEIPCASNFRVGTIYDIIALLIPQYVSQLQLSAGVISLQTLILTSLPYSSLAQCRLLQETLKWNHINTMTHSNCMDYNDKTIL